MGCTFKSFHCISFQCLGILVWIFLWIVCTLCLVCDSDIWRFMPYCFVGGTSTIKYVHFLLRWMVCIGMLGTAFPEFLFLMCFFCKMIMPECVVCWCNYWTFPITSSMVLNLDIFCIYQLWLCFLCSLSNLYCILLNPVLIS